MEVISNELHFGAKLTAGVSCGPGTLMYITSAGTASLADHSGSLWAHGVALTSGSGTKANGISQYIRLDRVARVVDASWSGVTKGNAAYLGEDGKIATSGTQKVGFFLDSDEAFIDLDMQLGA